jgi:hypothetical protein
MKITRMLFPFGFTVAVLAAAPLTGAFAANEGSSNAAGSHKHDTAKGAGVGALAGHEVGSGHAAAGAAVGAAVGHHEKKKAERNGD